MNRRVYGGRMSIGVCSCFKCAWRARRALSDADSRTMPAARWDLVFSKEGEKRPATMVGGDQKPRGVGRPTGRLNAWNTRRPFRGRASGLTRAHARPRFLRRLPHRTARAAFAARGTWASRRADVALVKSAAGYGWGQWVSPVEGSSEPGLAGQWGAHRVGGARLNRRCARMWTGKWADSPTDWS